MIATGINASFDELWQSIAFYFCPLGTHHASVSPCNIGDSPQSNQCKNYFFEFDILSIIKL
ncbi:hypothetical protein BRY73_15500 [Ochrobactrum sp. P6BS-III]|nr:hypothetical protein BRY73_15500 [Ochrobactrum sp. P6BS-III]